MVGVEIRDPAQQLGRGRVAGLLHDGGQVVAVLVAELLIRALGGDLLQMCPRALLQGLLDRLEIKRAQIHVLLGQIAADTALALQAVGVAVAQRAEHHAAGRVLRLVLQAEAAVAVEQRVKLLVILQLQRVEEGHHGLLRIGVGEE